MALATSARKVAGEAETESGEKRSRKRPRGSRCASLRITARARRRRRLRTTAEPHWRLIAKPTWGNTSLEGDGEDLHGAGEAGSGACESEKTWSGAGAKTARTEPLEPRARERCSSAKAARLVIRPTVGEGTCALRR